MLRIQQFMIILVAILLGSINRNMAQPSTPSFPIIYSIDSPGTGISYVLQTSTQTVSLGTRLVDQSPDRQFVAFVQDGTLQVFNNATGQVSDVIEEGDISRVVWNDDQLLFDVAETTSYQYDLMTSQLEAIPLRSIPTTLSVSLPNTAPDEYRLFSPDYTHALYWRCYSGGTKLWFGDTVCKNGGRLVIYDVVGNSVLRSVLNAATGIIDLGGAFWSPTGRFVVLPAFNSPGYVTNVYIYDVVNKTTLDVPVGTGPKFSGYMGFSWAPDESAIAWWRHNAAGLHRIDVYQMGTGERVLTSVPAFSEQTGVFGAEWEWGRTPDTIVWLDQDDNLYEVNFRTAVVNTLASNVVDVVYPWQPYPYPPPGCSTSLVC